MNRIKTTFDQLNKDNKKALGIFVTAGDPDFETSLKLITNLPDSGVDFIEIGMPFSDPMADGPSIQLSSQRALKSGMNLKKCLSLIKIFRDKNSHTPIILMGYYNPIYKFGKERFIKKCIELGVDALIIVDLPPEEDHYINIYTKKYNVHNIRLLTPTTHKERLKKILQHTSGFIYYVSVMGITGTKKPSINEVKKSLKKIRKISNLPICVGFGIKNKNQIQSLNKFSDGCVVGSAIVSFIEEFDKGKYSENQMLKNISDFLANLKK